MFVSKALNFGVLVAVAGGATAQEALGFQPTSTLNVTFGTNNVSPPGELIPRPETASPPNITAPEWTSGGSAVLLLVDSDVPRNGSRVELLHWLVSDVTLGADNQTLQLPGPGEATYLQPSPPVGDTPHQYTFVLFSQPDDFEVPEEFEGFLQTRINFNASRFAQAANLGQPFAGNSFRVQNLTGTPTTTFPPPRATDTTATTPTTPTAPAEFTGAAVPLAGDRTFWAGLSTFVLTGIAAFAL